MNTTSRIATSVCAVLLFVSASSFADNATNQLPTIAEIDAEIAGLANQYGAKILWPDAGGSAGAMACCLEHVSEMLSYCRSD